MIRLLVGCLVGLSVTVNTLGSYIAQNSISFKKESSVVAEDIKITISAVGDITIGDKSIGLNSAETGSFSSYLEYADNDYTWFLSKVADIFRSDDLTIGNLETVISASKVKVDKHESLQIFFRGKPKNLEILTSSGVDAVTYANNHTSDYGTVGLEDTVKYVDKSGLVGFGYDNTKIVEVKGVKIGLIGKKSFGQYRTDKDKKAIRKQIAQLREDGALLVILVLHGGTEKAAYPSSEIKSYYRSMIDEGVDLVLGHHPHVLQGIETYKGKQIVYSLGNFCYAGHTNPSDLDTMIFQQTFTFSSDNKLKDTSFEIIPCSISSISGKNNCQPVIATGKEATRILKKIKERSKLN